MHTGLAWLCAATVQAAAPVVTPLLFAGGTVADAEYLPLPDGRVAIAASIATPGGVGWVVLPRAADDGAPPSWTAIPTPGGTLVTSDDGLWSVTAWPDALRAGRVWQLVDDRFEPRPTLPDTGGVSGVQAVSVDDGRVEAWVTQGGTLVHRVATRGAWQDRARPGARAWDDEGEVFVQTAATIEGRRRHRVPAVSPQTALSFDEDDRGQPLFAALDAGRLRAWYAGHAFVQRVPAGTPIDRTVCPSEPRTDITVHHAMPRMGRLAFGPDGAVIPVVQTTRTARLGCRERPAHPCDPAGPIDTCPRGPQFEFFPVDKTHDVERTLFVLRGHGETWRWEAVAVPISPERVLDTRVVGDETWLLVEATDEMSMRTLHHVRLDAEGPPSPVSWPLEAELSPLTLDAVLAAGLTPGQGTSPYVPPAEWTAAALHTGGERHGTAWIDVVRPDATAPLTVTVDADVAAWGAGCGQPELRLWSGRRVWSVLLGDGQAGLVDPAVHGPRPLDGPGSGRHTWGLSLVDDELVVTIDGETVHRAAVPPPELAGAGVSFGQRSTCGNPVGPAVTWHAARVSAE